VGVCAQHVYMYVIRFACVYTESYGICLLARASRESPFCNYNVCMYTQRRMCVCVYKIIYMCVCVCGYRMYICTFSTCVCVYRMLELYIISRPLWGGYD